MADIWDLAPVAGASGPKSVWDLAPAFGATPTPPRQANGIRQAVISGLQSSATGLAFRGKLPDEEVSPDAPWYVRAAAGGATLHCVARRRNTSAGTFSNSVVTAWQRCASSASAAASP